MGDEHLRKLFSNIPRRDLKSWYERKILTARYLRASLLRLSGAAADTSLDIYLELPQAEEIVAETVRRILDRHNDRYLWDGAGDFDKFFARCLKTTMNGLRSSERNHRRGQEKLHSTLDPYFASPLPDRVELADINDNRIARRQSGRLLAGAIAKTQMRGTVLRYAERLQNYAEAQLATEDIARDLGVEPSSIDPFRHRIRKALKKTDK